MEPRDRVTLALMFAMLGVYIFVITTSCYLLRILGFVLSLIIWAALCG